MYVVPVFFPPRKCLHDRPEHMIRKEHLVLEITLLPHLHVLSPTLNCIYMYLSLATYLSNLENLKKYS